MDLLVAVVAVEFVCPLLLRPVPPRPLAAAALMLVVASAGVVGVVLMTILVMVKKFQIVCCSPRLDSVVSFEMHLFAVQVCYCGDLCQFFVPDFVVWPGRRLFERVPDFDSVALF